MERIKTIRRFSFLFRYRTASLILGGSESTKNECESRFRRLEYSCFYAILRAAKYLAMASFNAVIRINCSHLSKDSAPDVETDIQTKPLI